MPNPIADDRMPDFGSYGIQDLSKTPSVSNFPRKFGQNGFPIWHKMVTSEQYEDMCWFASGIEERWKWCIENYIKLCEKAAIFPFKVSAEQSKTDVAVVMLSLARRRLKAYFKGIKLFEKVKILSTSRRYILKPTAFELEIKALLLPVEDPKFYDWLLTHPPGPLFRTTGTSKHLEKILYRSPETTCTIRFDLSYMKRVTMTVNIELGSPINLPYHGTTLSKAFLNRYIEEHIWLPLVRTHRFDNAGWRLF